MTAPVTTARTAPAQLPASRPAHRDSNVLRWLAAYTASMLGDGVYFLALGFAAAQVAPPAQVGMVMAAGAVPRALLMLGGGVVADRFGPRRVVIGSDAVRCLLVLSAALALAVSTPGLWLLVALSVVFGVVDALFMPAVGALPPRLVASDQLIRLQGMRALVIRGGNIIGPPVGGIAMGLGGAGVAFALAGGLFALSVPLLVGTRIGALPEEAAGGPAPDTSAGRPDGAGKNSAWHDLVDGLRYLRRHPLVGPLAVSGALCELGLVGPLNVGMILLTRDRGWGSAGYGWIIGAFGAGATVGALLLTVRGSLPRAGAVQIGTLFAGAAALGTIGLAPSQLVAVALALLTGLFCGVCGSLAFALIQSATAPGYLGRVTAVMSLTGFGLAPLAYPLFGGAVAAWGPAPVFPASAAFGALGGLLGLLTPAIRTAELPRRAPVSAPAPAAA